MKRDSWSLEQCDHAEATVIRILVPKFKEDYELQPVRDELYRLAETGTGPLVLDFSALKYLSTVWLGCLVTLRKTLMQRGKTFERPCRRRALFAFYVDVAEALEAIRNGESDPLLLCGISKEMMEMFKVC